jgi:S1-C subfamily serine protease
VRAQLLHLTGRLRGETVTHEKQALLFGSAPEADIRYTEGLTIKPRHASLEFVPDRSSFHFKALEGEIFVNDKEVAEVILEDGDLIQLGRGGPRMRFRAHVGKGRPCKPVTQMLRDARAVRHASGFLASSIALRRDLARHSTWRFRILLGLLIVALLFGVASIGGWIGTQRTVVAQENLRQKQAELLEQEVEKLRRQLEEFRQTQAGHAPLDEVVKLRRELTRHRVVVDDLVREKAAFRRVLDEYSRGVCLLHGIFTLLAKRGGKLHGVTGPGGEPLRVEYVGSGFLASADGHVITNRHVAEPWWNSAAVEPLILRGFVPRFVMLEAVFPGQRPLRVDPATIRLSPEADVAVLRLKLTGVPVLPLTDADVATMRGGRVVVLGYPTGINAMLARAEPTLVADVLANSHDTTTLVAELAKRNAISPGHHPGRAQRGQANQAGLRRRDDLRRLGRSRVRPRRQGDRHQLRHHARLRRLEFRHPDRLREEALALTACRLLEWGLFALCERPHANGRTPWGIKRARATGTRSGGCPPASRRRPTGCRAPKSGAPARSASGRTRRRARGRRARPWGRAARARSRSPSLRTRTRTVPGTILRLTDHRTVVLSYCACRTVPGTILRLTDHGMYRSPEN